MTADCVANLALTRERIQEPAYVNRFLNCAPSQRRRRRAQATHKKRSAAIKLLLAREPHPPEAAGYRVEYTAQLEEVEERDS